MTSPHTTNPGTDRYPRDSETDVFGITHPGKVREVNQDHFIVSSLRKEMRVHGTSLPEDSLSTESERLAMFGLVADGVGGGRKGEEASRLAVESITQYVAHTMRAYYTHDASDHEAFIRQLEDAAYTCHAKVLERAKGDPRRKGMATTLTMWIGAWPNSYLLQVGDSRFYVLRRGRLTQISRDQTMAQELVDQGVLTRTAAFSSRWAHVLSSSIGGQQTAPVITRLPLEWETVGLLCSDGLTKHVSDDGIRERLVSMTSAKQVCEDLLQDALDGGGTDNITIVVARTVRQDGAAESSMAPTTS